MIGLPLYGFEKCNNKNVPDTTVQYFLGVPAILNLLTTNFEKLLVTLSYLFLQQLTSYDLVVTSLLYMYVRNMTS